MNFLSGRRLLVRARLFTPSVVLLGTSLGALLAASPALADCTKAGTQITCQGTTNVANGPLAEAAAGESVVNTGVATVSGNAAYAILGAGGGTRLTNAGTLTTTSDYIDAIEAIGNGHALANRGLVATQGVSADGLRAIGDRNTLTNTGEVRTGAGSNARAMVAEGAGNTLTNNGTILTQSLGSEGMNVAGNGNVAVNTGRIDTTGPVGNGMRAYGGGNAVLNAGTIATTGLEARGIKVDFGSGNEAVNRGTIRTSGIDAFGIWVASTAGQANTVINEAAGTVEAGATWALKLEAGDERVENYGLLATRTGPGAVDLGAGRDSFLIGASSRIVGIVDAGAGTDTFALGGTADGLLDASAIGAAAQYRNFEAYEKVGPSTWTVQGTGTAIMPWAVKEGTLVVTGRIEGAAMTVSAGAVLAGTGTVGSIDARADSILSPGVAGIGTLYVAGNVLVANGTVYRIDLNSGLQADRIHARGTATVAGGTVRVEALPGDYRPGSRWTILTADGGVTGQFSGVTTSLAFFQPVLTKDGQNIYLELPRIARALPRNRPVIDVYLPVAEEELSEVLDLTSGEAIVSATGVMVAHDDLFRGAVLCRLRCAASGLATFAAFEGVPAAFAADLPQLRAPAPVAVPAPRRDFAAWGKGVGSWGSTDAGAGTAGVERSTAGVVGGIDMGLGTPYRIGVAAGYFSTGLDIAGLSSRGQVESVHLGAYGSAALGAWTLRAGFAYGHHEVDLSRYVAFTGFSGSTRSTSAAESVQAFGEAGYGIRLGHGIEVEPFAGLAHLHVGARGVAEEGSAVAVAGRVHAFSSTFSTLGARVSATLPTAVGTVTFKGLLGWRHVFGDTIPKATFSYVSGSTPFVIPGAPIDRNSLVVEAGLNWAVMEKAVLSVGYSGTVGAKDREHTVRGGLTLRF